MRILYCINGKECKYVSVTNEIWISCEDVNFNYANISFIDSYNTKYTSETMGYLEALNYLDIIVRSGYLNLENYIFEAEEDE